MTIKTEDRMLAYLAKRITAQERLLVAYRIGGQPPSITLDTLADTRDWERVLQQYKAQR